MSRRVVVTGIGLVTPLGTGTEKSWKNICDGVSGVDLISRFDTSDFTVKIAAEVKDFVVEDFLEKKAAKHMDLFVQYGIVAAMMAREDSGLVIDQSNCDRVGLLLAVEWAGCPISRKPIKFSLIEDLKGFHHFFIPMVIPNMPSGQISMQLGTKGPNLALTTACAAGNHAIGEAYRHIKYGTCDAVVAGGTEAVVCSMGIAGFSSMKALSTRNDNPAQASRPFDKDRDGFVMSEGAGMLMLEEYEQAKARGARIYAEVAGYGLSSDAYHIAAPPEDAEGAVRCMRMAIEDAGLAPEDIDYVNAHGTSTPLNDRCETHALKTVFGDHAYKLAVSSTKSMTGHMLGAAGGIETIFTALGIYDQIAPPTINLAEASPECDLDYVANAARKMEINTAISNSFGFGGTNAVVVLKKCDR